MSERDRVLHRPEPAFRPVVAVLLSMLLAGGLGLVAGGLTPVPSWSWPSLPQRAFGAEPFFAADPNGGEWLERSRPVRVDIEAVGVHAPLVKTGGQLYAMFYERHNPVKYFFTDLLRWALRRLPEDRRYEACRRLIIRNRPLYRLLAHLIICAPYPPSGDPLEVSTLQLGLYDAYAPVFNHLHTREEVASWFQRCHFDRVVLTKPVRFTDGLDRFRYGECGGSINMRGVRS